MQREALRTIFARHRHIVQSVFVHGSRVKGKARPGSDVDLVIHGDIEPKDLAAIDRDLEESDLSIFWNLAAYKSLKDGPFKSEVDHWSKPLFTQADF